MTSTAPTRARRSYRKLTPAEETKLVAMREAGVLSDEDIAQHFGMSRRGVQDAARRLGARARGAAADEAVLAARERALATLPVVPDDPAVRARHARDAAYRSSVTLQHFGVLAAQQAVQELGAAGSIRVLHKVADVLAKARALAWSSLGLDGRMPATGDDLPELLIRELTDPEVVAIRDQQRDDDAALGIEHDDDDDDDGCGGAGAPAWGPTADLDDGSAAPEASDDLVIEGENTADHAQPERVGGDDAHLI